LPRGSLWLVALVGDLAVFALFPLLGMAGHDWTLTSERFARTFLPFAFAWPAVALLARAYATPALRSARLALLIVLPAWLIAGVAGIGIRVVLFDRSFSLAFALVAIGLTGAMLVIWRVTLAVLRNR
jgi:hypothetical protein